MSDAKRLGPWGWFVRAFAAGLGTVCGLMMGAFLACVLYGITAGGIWVLSSVGRADHQPQARQVAPPTLLVQPPAVPYGSNPTSAYPAPHGHPSFQVRPTEPVESPPPTYSAKDSPPVKDAEGDVH